MGVCNNPGSLPKRRDLNTTININPDEGGMIELLLCDGEVPQGIESGLDHLIESAVGPDAEVLDREFHELKDGSGYECYLVGYPADSRVMSAWEVTLKIKE
jgi:hypothetical protein